MRIKVLRLASVDQIDGIDLRRFVPGLQYDVGNQIGALMLAEGWAEPVADDQASATPGPFSEDDPFVSCVIDRNNPPNLVRETYPPYVDDLPDPANDPEQRRRSPPHGS